MLIIIFFATAAAKLIVSITCTQLNLGHLAPCSWEPVVISLNCLQLNMNSTNKTLLFDRFLIMYNLCFHLYYRHVCISLYTCANVICINSYLLTYSTLLLTVFTQINFVADFLQAKCYFNWKTANLHFLNPLWGGLRAMYDVHLRLTRKCVVDFLLV